MLRVFKQFIHFVVNIFAVRENSKFQFIGAAVSNKKPSCR